ncbi:zinc finger, CCHC-type, retrotransposon gag domain protein [Tanacetum coccineum]|uniref:Zinc finger, CCHC-type, retrotransposon gag domain protein n=1 Tax=Tanacetum coccineum TaxID=301880 RepID=A0ABQ4XRB1_9ASTR
MPLTTTATITATNGTVAREMEGKSSGGYKQTPAKNPDAPVTKGELGNEIKRIMSEHLPTILAQSQENFRKAKEARKAAKEAEKKKNANIDAEKRRKAMEDKRAGEEQKRKRKVGQDMKNAEDAERRKNEEAERQRNVEAQRDGCSYKSFLNCKPTEFHSENDPDMTKIARGNEVVTAMTCEQFEELVMENYCPQGLMDKLKEELLKLQQNDMTVPKYTTKFNEKARFAKYQVATEERRIKQYIYGVYEPGSGLQFNKQDPQHFKKRQSLL